MKSNRTIALALLAFALGTTWLLRAEHPAEAAERKLEVARTTYEKAEAAILAAIGQIDEPSKRKATLAAFKSRKALWRKLADEEASFTIAASPLPDTSTSSSLVPYWTEARHLEAQAKQLGDETKWINDNWGPVTRKK